MYSLNLLDRNVLITADEVVKKVNVSSIDPHKFLAAIEIAEERFIRPLLGSELYEDIIAVKNVVVTDANKATLQANITLKDGNGIYQLQNGDIVNALELLSSNYQQLWKERLWKLTAECVFMVALPENYAQFASAGIIKNNPNPSFMESGSKGQSSGVDLKDIKYLTDKAMIERVEPLKIALQDYLVRNARLFPLYPAQKVEECKQQGRKTPWLTGVYKNRDRW